MAKISRSFQFCLLIFTLVILQLCSLSNANYANFTPTALVDSTRNEDKTSAVSLLFHENQANFGKNFYVMIGAQQPILSGYTFENYNFNYWMGVSYCNRPNDPPCDIRMCGTDPFAEVFCDTTLANPYCKCRYGTGSDYPRTCQSPLFVLDVENYYFSTKPPNNGKTTVRNSHVLTICTLEDGKEPPVAPEPSQLFNVLTLDDGSPGLKLGITWDTYVKIPDQNAYYWTSHSVVVLIDKQSLAMVLNKLEPQQLGDMLDEKMVREIARLKGL